MHKKSIYLAEYSTSIIEYLREIKNIITSLVDFYTYGGVSKERRCNKFGNWELHQWRSPELQLG